MAVIWRLIVQKYGGSSVGSAERIQNVARRIEARATAGDRVVAVVSAMGDKTDELSSLPASSRRGPLRARWTCCSPRARSSRGALSMALGELGANHRLTGAQAGIDRRRHAAPASRHRYRQRLERELTTAAS